MIGWTPPGQDLRAIGDSYRIVPTTIAIFYLWLNIDPLPDTVHNNYSQLCQ